MSDQKNNSDAFEEFFKKKAGEGEYDISYREEDWMKLEKKLDLQDAKISYRRRVRWIAAASILIVSLLGYFTYQNYNRINRLNELLDQQITSLEDQNRTNQEPPVSDPESPVQANPQAEQQANTETEDETIAHTPDVQPAPENNSGEVLPGNSAGNITTAPALTREEIASLRVYPIDYTDNYGFFDTPPPSDEFESLAIAEVNRQENVSSSGRIENRTNTPAPLSGLAVGLLISPDLSSVGSASDFNNLGYKFGLALSYNVTPRLSLSTGIVQARVNYTASGQDYSPPGYWTRPEQVVAECTIIDIPVNINYSLFEFQKSRITTSVGLSSYIMRDEEYRFDYGSNGPQNQSWSGKTGERHWFSNAGLSIGYELDVHPNWSVKLEPSIKVPVKEIGWGNVKLYSVGSFVSINYKL